MGRGRVALALGTALYAAVWAGWWLHASPPDARVLGPFSARYLVFLAAAALPFGVPPLLLLARRRLGPRRFAAWLVACGAGALVVAGLAEQRHAWTQEHRFDPWLQHAPPRIPAALAGARGPRVLLLGGSTTEGVGLPPGARYADVLEGLLRQARPDVAVANCGMSWFTTQHALVAYVTDLADWRPTVVVHMEGINDLVRSLAPDDLSSGEYDDRWAHYYGAAAGGLRPPAFGEGLLRRMADDWCSTARLRPVDVPEWPSVARAERHLRQLARRARADGARLVVVTQPFLVKDDPGPAEAERYELTRSHVRRRGPWLEYPAPRSVRAGLAACAERARAVARDEGALLVDAEARVPKTLEHFRDEVHARAPGARLLAELVARALLDARLLD